MEEVLNKFKLIIMEPLKLFNNIFLDTFNIENHINYDDLSKESLHNWDSVHQLNLVNQLEDTFDIILDPEDIMGFTSYIKGKEILAKYGVKI